MGQGQFLLMLKGFTISTSVLRDVNKIWFLFVSSKIIFLDHVNEKSFHSPIRIKSAKNSILTTVWEVLFFFVGVIDIYVLDFCC